VIVGMCGQLYNHRNEKYTRCKINDRNFDFTIQCATIPSISLSWTDTNDAGVDVKSEAAKYATCPTGTLATGISNGVDLKCAKENPSEAVVLDHTDTVTICGDEETVSCPDGYVMTKMCNAIDKNHDSYNLNKKDGCHHDICSGASGYVSNGVLCTAVAAYKYHDTVDAVANDEKARFEIHDCKSDFIDHPTDLTYTVTNTIRHTSSVRTETKSSSESGTKITDTLKTAVTISLEAGLPVGKLKTDVGTEESNTVETSFSTSQSYIDEQYSSTEREQSVSQELTLTGGLAWNILSWGASVEAHGDYVARYYSYRPGSEPEIITEDVMIANTDLNDNNYLIGLDSSNFDEEYLRMTSCETIADHYMNREGPFADTSSESDFERSMSVKTSSTHTVIGGDPHAFKTVDMRRRLRGGRN